MTTMVHHSDNEKSFADELLLAAAEYARSRGYSLGPDCEGDLEILVSSSADRFQRDAGREFQSKMNEAKSNILRLVDEMIGQADADQLSTLQSAHFALAWSRLRNHCPIFPFFDSNGHYG
jgi:hypothetical protein